MNDGDWLGGASKASIIVVIKPEQAVVVVVELLHEIKHIVQ